MVSSTLSAPSFYLPRLMQGGDATEWVRAQVLESEGLELSLDSATSSSVSLSFLTCNIGLHCQGSNKKQMTYPSEVKFEEVYLQRGKLQRHIWGIEKTGEATPALSISSSQIIPTSRPQRTRQRFLELETRESTGSFEHNSDLWPWTRSL